MCLDRSENYVRKIHPKNISHSPPISPERRKWRIFLPRRGEKNYHRTKVEEGSFLLHWNLRRISQELLCHFKLYGFQQHVIKLNEDKWRDGEHGKKAAKTETWIIYSFYVRFKCSKVNFSRNVAVIHDCSTTRWKLR